MPDFTPLEEENETLKRRLAEAEETLSAIRSGEVDAVVVRGGKGNEVYTLTGAERPYRRLVESMTEGAAILLRDGTVLYCNGRLAEMVALPLASVIGGLFQRFVAARQRPTI